MQTAQVKLLFTNAEIAKSVEAVSSQSRKLVKDLFDAFACNHLLEPEPVKRIERLRLLVLEDHPDAGNPIRHLTPN
jgi:hypothetical protein